MELRCPACDRRYDAATAWRCRCGEALAFVDPLAPPDTASPAGFERDSGAGVWAFAELLPPVGPVSLGEGWTPERGASDLCSLGKELSLKLEYVSPTGSFKDRGAAVTVALAAHLGVDRVLEDSSGNAGLATAAYAARAGLDAQIYVPAGAAGATVDAIERTGATVRQIEGDRAAVTAACVDAVEDGEGWYASHAWHPAFLAGTATMAYEIAARRDWQAPEAVVLPVGHGTLLLGAHRGFQTLAEAGWIEAVPSQFVVQAAGVAPIAARLGNEIAGRNDLAAGIQVADPARADEIVAAIEASGGDAVAVTRAATERARNRLARAGFSVAPTSAVALAGLERYVEEGLIEPAAEVVLPLTGIAR